MRRTFLLLAISFAIFASVQGQGFDYSPGFKAGAPEPMQPLAFLEGAWDVTLYFPQETDATKDAQWAYWDSTSSIITSSYGGALLHEQTPGFPISPNAVGADGLTNWSYQSWYSYDRFQNQYRIAIIDNVMGLLDIYEGKLEHNTLEASNLETQTYNQQGPPGTRQKNRITLSEMSPDRFVLTWSLINLDEGMKKDDLPWQWSVRMVYTRRADN